MRLPAKDPRERLKDAIRRSGLSQSDFAKIHLGMNRQNLNSILAGRANPGVKRGAKIEEVTGIPLRDWAKEEKP